MEKIETINQLQTKWKEARFAKNKELASAYASIKNAAANIAKADGNRPIEDNDLKLAAKAEQKMMNQAKEAGAPFNALVFEICESILPKLMTESETTTAVKAIIDEIENPSMKNMGQIMGKLSKEYGELLDKGLASKIIKSILTA